MGVPRTSSRLRCDRLLLLLAVLLFGLVLCTSKYCISIREEGNSLPEGTATAAQQSRLSQGDRQQKGSCCFRFTSPGLWLGIAWHKRRGSRLSLWRPQKLSQMFVRSGEIPSPGQTSSDKNNDCAMKSERGTPVRGSDPPSGHSVYKTTGDRWRAPARHLTQTYFCLLYTSPSPRDGLLSRMPSSA